MATVGSRTAVLPTQTGKIPMSQNEVALYRDNPMIEPIASNADEVQEADEGAVQMETGGSDEETERDVMGKRAVRESTDRQQYRVLQVQVEGLKVKEISIMPLLVSGPGIMYIAYEMSISNGNDLKWTVVKRFSQFFSLRKRMLSRAKIALRKYPEEKLVVTAFKNILFPRRRFFSSCEPSVVMNRSEGLKQWLEDVFDLIRKGVVAEMNSQEAKYHRDVENDSDVLTQEEFSSEHSPLTESEETDKRRGLSPIRVLEQMFKRFLGFPKAEEGAIMISVNSLQDVAVDKVTSESTECCICLEYLADFPDDNDTWCASPDKAGACSKADKKGNVDDFVGNSSALQDDAVSDEFKDEQSIEGRKKSAAHPAVVQLRCGHIFHESCAVEWLRKRRCCAFCMTPTVPGQGQSQAEEGKMLDGES